MRSSVLVFSTYIFGVAFAVVPSPIETCPNPRDPNAIFAATCPSFFHSTACSQSRPQQALHNTHTPRKSSMEDFEERIRRRMAEKAGSKSTRADGRNLLGYDSPVNSNADNVYDSNDGRPRFPNAIQDWHGTPRMLRERSMLALMGEITDKPGWTKKVFAEEIVKKWRKEAAEQAKSQKPERMVTEKMFEFCIAELRDYAKAQEASRFVPALDADAAVYKSDTVISDELRLALREAAAPLEDVPEARKDWHPGSDDKVLDLVHPSLFPLLYGRTRILPEDSVPLEDCDKYIGKGEIIAVPKEDDIKVKQFPGLSAGNNLRLEKQHYYSARFQWLPCEVAFTDDDEVMTTSYINNLHPKDHKPLYEAIEKIMARALPMWEATLASTERASGRDGEAKRRIPIGDAEYTEPEGTRPKEPDESEMDEDEIDEMDEEWRKENRILTMPEPEDYSLRTPYQHPVLGEGYRFRRDDAPDKKIGLRSLFEKQGLQVIIKLANIHLDPSKPSYDGGTWHVEGQLNEHICASALYYYDSENINDSYLSFREATDVDYLTDPFGGPSYEQDDYQHFELLYDIKQNEAAVQVLGKVKTPQGRLLTFPNVFHHRVEPFSVTDKTKPGHRKILALFLVDPYNRIPSTANVPPQQKDWWRRMLLELDRVGELPPELAENVVESAGEDFPISLEEAKSIRKELMEERKMFAGDVEARVQEETFSFCEH